MKKVLLVELLALLFFGFTLSALTQVAEAHPTAVVPAAPSGVTRTYPGGSPCDTTLQACISASADGDAVQISAGTYVTASLSITRAVSLVGGGANPSAVKLRPTSGRMIQYDAPTIMATTVISNLTVENGNSGASSGGGIRVLVNSGVPLFHSIVVSNNIGFGGGGIRIIAAAPAMLVNVTVFSNTSSGGGGGISTAGDLTLVNSRIERNSADADGGGVYLTGALAITNTVFDRNTAALLGGAASVSGTALVSNTLFTSNRVSGTNGMGGALWVTGTLNITNSTFLTNSVTSSTGSGGAVGARQRIGARGSTFQGNSATTGGALRGLGDVFALDTTLIGNGSSSNGMGGGIAAISVTVASVTFTQNSVCCTGSSGGGISATLAIISNGLFIRNSAFISGGAVIANQVLITNSQFLTNTGPTEGGAVWTRGGSITNTQFIANSTGCCSNRAGGALFARGTILVYGSQFIGNDSDHGGAIFMQGNSSEIHDSTFGGNRVDCCGGGGAIDTLDFGPSIYTSTFSDNHVDCCDEGGALRAGLFVHVEGSAFKNNAVGCCNGGGAIFIPVGISAISEITATTFISNYAQSGGGGAVWANRVSINTSTFISNHVASNQSGGALSINASGSLADLTFTDNRVDTLPGSCGSGVGGALFGETGSALAISRATIANNSAHKGGALFARGSATVDQSSFADNSVVCLDSLTLSNVGYGGAIAAQDTLTVRRSSFLRNSAGSVGGGALAHLPLAIKTLRVENSLFARNVATNTVFGAHGAAIAISMTNPVQLFFNTFASPTPNTVSAIAVYSGTTSVIDNIITGHAVGIERLGGTAFEDHNLFFANTANLSGGVTSGGSSLTGDPLFVAPAADNYHLGAGSPALDNASDLLITVDYDGDGRPIGAGFDIGFDERNAAVFNLYLPVILR